MASGTKKSLRHFFEQQQVPVGSSDSTWPSAPGQMPFFPHRVACYQLKYGLQITGSAQAIASFARRINWQRKSGASRDFARLAGSSPLPPSNLEHTHAALVVRAQSPQTNVGGCPRSLSDAWSNHSRRQGNAGGLCLPFHGALRGCALLRHKQKPQEAAHGKKTTFRSLFWWWNWKMWAIYLEKCIRGSSISWEGMH